MTTSTINKEDLHVIVDSVHVNGVFEGYQLASGPLSYDEAIDQWYKIQQRDSLRIGTYSVRSLAEPRFGELVQGPFVDAVSRTPGRTSHGDSGLIKAAKAHAKTIGVHGAPGGWVYTISGQAICQGWSLYADNLRRLGVLREHDGAWFIVNGRKVVS